MFDGNFKVGTPNHYSVLLVFKSVNLTGRGQREANLLNLEKIAL